MKENSVQDKIVLVTGSTDGIGKETARKLARHGAKVIIHGRDHAKVQAVADEIRQSTGSRDINFLVADFSCFPEVGRMVTEIRKTFPTLQILINNAGVYSDGYRITDDGFEQTLQVQYLIPFLLTNLLLDILAGNRPSRIVNVTSVLHKGAELDFTRLQDPSRYEGHAAYSTSKLALTLYTFELAERVQNLSVTVNCVHPGAVNTKLLRAGVGSHGMTPEQGAEAPFFVAATPELADTTGKYFERDQQAEPDPRAYNQDLRKRLWEHTEHLLQLHRDRKRAA